MSKSQDKKMHNSDGFGLGNKMSPRDKEDDKHKKTVRTAVATVIAVALLFAGAMFINSDYIRQTGTAVKIGDVKYSITDFEYYYQNVYIQYYNSVSGMGDFGSSMLPEQGTALESQIYNEDTGETWADFFQTLALEQMKADNTIYAQALKADFQLPDDKKEKFEQEMDGIEQTAYAYGYQDVASYLNIVYGKGMTDEYFRKAAERTYLIEAYSQHVRDSFTYSPEEIEAYYNDSKDNFDTFTYRYFLVMADEVKEEDYDDDAAYEAANDEALAAAAAKAQAYADVVTDEQGFIDAARDYDPEVYAEDSASQRVYKGEWLGSTYGDWLKDSARQTGDASALESVNGTYVVYFDSRSDNHYQTVSIQQILVQPETINEEDYLEEETSAAYDEAVEQAKIVAENAATEINDAWIAAGATQDKLTELTETYVDQISTVDSVLLEGVFKEQLPPEVTAWIFDEARQTNDYKLVYSETTGYYIVYFVGTGDTYSNILAETKKRDKDLQAWKESLPIVDANVKWLMTLV